MRQRALDYRKGDPLSVFHIFFPSFPTNLSIQRLRLKSEFDADHGAGLIQVVEHRVIVKIPA